MDCVSSRVTSIARFVKLVSETSNFLHGYCLTILLHATPLLTE